MNTPFQKSNFEPHSSTKVLFCYGLDFTIYQKFEQWLKEDRFLIFLEDEVSWIKKSKRHKLAEKVQKHPNVRICFIENPFQRIPTLKKMLWEFVFSPAEIFSCKNSSDFQDIKKHFTELKEGIHFTASEYSDFGLAVMKNFYQNLDLFSDFKKYKDLKNQFSQIPAIILGAGPSLEKNQETLKTLQSHALFFAGGTALNSLAYHGIKPHFAASIDKEAPYQTFKHADIFNVPFFFQPRISNENLKIISSQKILVPDSSCFALENWIARELDLYQGSIDSGWNVATFLIQIAVYLGCNPIVFVGMDLAKSKEDVLYSKGTGVCQKKEIPFVKTKDLNNQEVYTQRDWLLARDWICNFTSNQDIYFLNASEGLDFGKNVKNQKLHAIDWKKNYDLDAYVYQILKNCPDYFLRDEKKTSVLREVEKSIRMTSFLIEEKLIELEDAYNENKAVELSWDEFVEEIFHEMHLHPLWGIFSSFFKKGEKGIGAQLHQLLFFQSQAKIQLNLILEYLNERNLQNRK